ncbi:Coatomer beta subunit [Ecytonucleospora hepatopenaei]|uniref:Coatomer beta subunit n=1 Tax=Ecytonucleospora hepatopenaei TaxID=646526 RepID=A0A1W0E9B5_9MICR|nr:Coatomer beta subunit [Ecytonucleospora hepatopenaei]
MKNTSKIKLFNFLFLTLIMEIQTNHNDTIRTPKIKVLKTDVNYGYILAGLYNGEVQQFVVDNGVPVMKKTVKISELPVRTLAFNLQNYQVFAGTDDGNVVVLDSENLNVINVFKAHDDFIRSIAVNEQENCFLTSSDDNCVKLFGLKDFMLINCYKDSKHYVMDVKFDNTDKTLFYTASLDGKIRKYNIFNTKRLDTFYCRPEKSKSYKTNTTKGIKNAFASLRTSKTVSFNTFNNLSGLNSFEFISKECFVTANDDGFITVYDKGRNTVLNMVKVHNGHINTVKTVKDGFFATTSNDGTMKIFNEMLNVEATIHSDFKIWDFCVYKNYILTGTDEELIVSHILTEKIVKKMAGNRVFTLKSDGLYCQKIGDLSEKHVGSFERDLIDFTLNETGKLIASISYSGIVIYSFLGLRKKFEISGGKDIVFGKEGFFILMPEKIVSYNLKFEKTNEFEVKNCEKIFDIKENESATDVLCSYEDSVCLYKNGDFVKKFKNFEDCFFVDDIEGNSLICLINDEKTSFYNYKSFFEIDVVFVDFKVYENVVYFITSLDSGYGFVYKNEFLSFSFRTTLTSILGLHGGILYSQDNSVDVDEKFITFQKSVLLGNSKEIAEECVQKAIAFYENLGMLEEALKITQNESQKFEILLKLEKFEEAFEIAKSPAKFEKLGNKFVELYKTSCDKKYLEKASEAYFKSGNLSNLFYTDAISSKKYLKYITETANKNGQKNLALVAAFANNDYSQCDIFFKNTLFENMFKEKFINK